MNNTLSLLVITMVLNIWYQNKFELVFGSTDKKSGTENSKFKFYDKNLGPLKVYVSNVLKRVSLN
jgi:hypothetical protein